MSDVVVIGGIFREILPPADRPVRRVGGSGFVAALTAAALGADVALVSFVGEHDALAAMGPLKRAGVDTSAIRVLPGLSGVFALSDLVDRRAPRPSYRPAEHVPASDIRASILQAPVVLAFGFPDFDPLPWIESAVPDGGTFLWDRQGWLSRNIDRLALDELPASRRIYVANLEEMRADANRVTYAAALADQPAASFDAALIKCGRWGTIAIEPEIRVDFIPAFVTEVVSAIGSGDCFAGAAAARLARGDTLVEAARTGAAAASLFVERQSNIPPPTLAQGIDEVLTNRTRCAVNPAGLEQVSLYLAGPWFSVAEELLIEELEAALANLGLNVVSPRRDIGELPSEPTAEQIVAFGRKDYAAIDDCALVVAVLDGDDSGTLMEVGYAAKAGKPVIGLNSGPDVRPQPMRDAAGVRLTRSVSELVEAITQWVRERHGVA